MFSFYDACVNTSQIDRVKGLPLKRLMAKYGSWNITDKDWNEQNWNFIKSLANMHRELGIMPLFKVAAEPDYKDSSRNILTVRFKADTPDQLLETKNNQNNQSKIFVKSCLFLVPKTFKCFRSARMSDQKYSFHLFSLKFLTFSTLDPVNPTNLQSR